MRQYNLALTALTAAILAGCGGSGVSDPAPKIKFTAQVSFGDSLSDVGTYAVGTIKALGGGKYTVNGPSSKNWTELVAAQLGLPAPCPAQTGLNGLASQGFSVPVTSNAGCTGYAQGGARVTNPVGPGNKALGGANAVLGQLTVPVVTQIQNHLAANGGKFRGDELVLVAAGANDLFMQMATLSGAALAAATAAGTKVGGETYITTLVGLLAAGTSSPANTATAVQTAMAAEMAKAGYTTESLTVAMYTAAAKLGFDQTKIPATVASAQATAAAAAAKAGADAGGAYAKANAQTYLDNMGTAGTELAGYVKSEILAKGAKYVVLVNMPDVSKTPFAYAQSAETQTLLGGLSVTFNGRLLAGVAGNDNIVLVDAYAQNRDQAANPGAYGLTNVTSVACDLTPAKNPLGSSLVCNNNNLVAGDVSKYLFADGVHPTPYGYSLLSDAVAKAMVKRGWM